MSKDSKIIVSVVMAVIVMIMVSQIVRRNSMDTFITRKEHFIEGEQLLEKLEGSNGSFYDVESDTLRFTGSDGKQYVAFDVAEYNDSLEEKHVKLDRTITRANEFYRDKPMQNFIMVMVIFALGMALKVSATKGMRGAPGGMGSGRPSQYNISKKEEADMAPKVTLENVKGHNEIIDDIHSIIEFIKEPLKYEAMGARLPKGVLLFGPPGTGKTLLAKAIAGESGVSFISASGSDFVEKYVGVGAKRVRELFADARKNAPCIIFIDEIDAIGRTRGSDDGNSERDNTLNAILTEMDGFKSEDNVFVLASTNRVDTLDSALVRAGRFDRHIGVNLPDVRGREEILQIYAKNKPLSEDVDLKEIAKLTTNFSGAELETLLNESAILAVRSGKEEITFNEIDTAIYGIQLKGYEKKDYKRTRVENLLVAYHEAGHTLASIILAGDEVTKVSIIPSTSGTGGVTFTNPKDNMLMSKLDLENQIRMMYAGRAAELILTGSEDKVTTGAHNDIERATALIYRMVTEFGMYKEFGIINMKMFKSNSTKVENKVRELSIKYYNETIEFIKDNKVVLKDLSEELIVKETLYKDEILAIVDRYTDNKVMTLDKKISEIDKVDKKEKEPIVAS